MPRVVVAPSVSVDEDITAFVAQDQALSQEHPDLAPSDVEWAQVVAEVRNEYRRYTTTVSPPNHALSLATAAYMLHLCRAISARRVLDLGSGFSSWVLRHHAETASNPVDVVSVDTDEDWPGDPVADPRRVSVLEVRRLGLDLVPVQPRVPQGCVRACHGRP